MNSAVLLAALSGLGLSVTASGYKVGAFGKVAPIQSAAMLSVVGMIVFGLLGWSQWQSAPATVFVLGIIAGVTQYLTIILIESALNRGPLSPVWCANSLAFMPVIIYAAIFCGEALSVWQLIAIAATIGAIISASFSAGNGGSVQTSAVQKFCYLVILVLTLGCNSLMFIVMKYASSLPCGQGSLNSVYGNVMMSMVYLSLLLCGGIDLTIKKKWVFNRYALFGGAMLSAGACTAFFLQLILVDKAPAVIVFALSSSVSILVTALVSVVFFKEPLRKSWFFTVAFALIAIIFNR